MLAPAPEVARGLRAGARLVVDGPAIADRYRSWLDAGGQGQDPVEARDAAYECDHGRLAGDRTPPCGCFPSLEPPPLHPTPIKETPMRQSKKKPRRVRVTSGPRANPDFLVQMVDQFDAEIERLSAARDALKKVAA